MNGPAWTDIELETLDRNFARIGPTGCMDLLPGRTPVAISIRACKRGLKWIRDPSVPQSRVSACKIAHETYRRAHAEDGCVVRLVLMGGMWHDIRTQNAGGQILEPVLGTVGFYKAGCTAREIQTDIAFRIRELNAGDRVAA